MQTFAIVTSLLVTVVALSMAAKAFSFLVRMVRTGRADTTRYDDPGGRLVNAGKEVGLHTKMLTWSIPGAAHWLIMIGFVLLVGTLVEAYGELFDEDFKFPLLSRYDAYGVAIELINLGTLVGILVLIAVRLSTSPLRSERKSRFTGSNRWHAWFVELVILGVSTAIFTIRGLRVAEGTFPYGDGAFVSRWLGENVFDGLSHDTLRNLTYAALTFKIVISMAWFMVISSNPNMGIAWHRFTAPVNIYFKRRPKALGALLPMNVDFENPADDAVFGAGKIEDLTWKQQLDLVSCTECGRCQSQCPAWNTAKPLSPKLLIMNLRDHMVTKAPYLLANGDGSSLPANDPAWAAALAESERPLVGTYEQGGVIDPDVLWSCTTCGACVEQCPVDIEHVDTIIDLRRYQVLVESSFPSEAGTMMRNLEQHGNPWGMSGAARLEWAEGLPFEVRVFHDHIPDDVDWLFWVGCAGALEDRSKKVTRAVAELLDTAGVSWGVLGPQETCTGDPARRLGNEYLFQELAKANVEMLNAKNAKRIVASCPHCFNTIANEYPQLGGDYEVVHHTQLLATLVDEGRLVPVTPVDAKVTYHDPCYLGRHNEVYTPPREVLATIEGLRSEEMHRCKERGFCCGAGGARMWMEEKIGRQINVERVDEALAVEPDVVSTACPYCMVMLGDAVTAKKLTGEAKEHVQVLDVAQLLQKSLVRPAAPVEAVPPPVTEAPPAESDGEPVTSAAE